MKITLADAGKWAERLGGRADSVHVEVERDELLLAAAMLLMSASAGGGLFAPSQPDDDLTKMTGEELIAAVERVRGRARALKEEIARRKEGGEGQKEKKE